MYRAGPPAIVASITESESILNMYTPRFCNISTCVKTSLHRIDKHFHSKNQHGNSRDCHFLAMSWARDGHVNCSHSTLKCDSILCTVKVNKVWNSGSHTLFSESCTENVTFTQHKWQKVEESQRARLLTDLEKCRFQKEKLTGSQR